MKVTLRLYAGLLDLLPPERRGCALERALACTTTVKDLVEGLGVPHTEVDLILVDGRPVGFSHRVADGDRVAVFPAFEGIDPGPVRLRPVRPSPPRFATDVHLGRLATLLRLLGFDTWWRNDARDEDLAKMSASERRILLTRDRGLLKRSEVVHGHLVRACGPEGQLAEVVRAYDLVADAAPFTRCARCNRELVPARADEVDRLVPARVRERATEYRKCPGCGRIFWRGTHVERLERLFAGVLGGR